MHQRFTIPGSWDWQTTNPEINKIAPGLDALMVCIISVLVQSVVILL